MKRPMPLRMLHHLRLRLRQLPNSSRRLSRLRLTDELISVPPALSTCEKCSMSATPSTDKKRKANDARILDKGTVVPTQREDLEPVSTHLTRTTMMKTTKTTILSITIKITTPEHLFLPKFPELRKGPPMLQEWKTNYVPQDLAPSRVLQPRLGKPRLAATATSKTEDTASIVRPLPLLPGRALPVH